MKANKEFLDNMTEMILLENEYGVIKYANTAFCRCFDVSQEDIIGRSVFDFIIAEDREICCVEELVSPERPQYRIEGRSKRADGKIIWIQYVGRAHFDKDGNRVGFQEIGIDITEWKEKIDEKTKELEVANDLLNKMNSKPVTSEYIVKQNKGGEGFYAAHKFTDITTDTPDMKMLINYAKSVAKGNAAILIEGESGTGKELFAQAIHNESFRSNGPFVAINCGAIPAELIGSEFFGYVEGAFTGASKGGKPGKFELASGGTVFLDEIGEMPMSQQVVLLRVLETKSVTRIGGDKVIPIDIRVVCATNKDLPLEIEMGNFRKDLYYRLNVINIRIPPLRERKADILLLMGKFIKKYGSKNFKNKDAFSVTQLMKFYNYDWPGNVRELQNIVERLMYLPAWECENIIFGSNNTMNCNGGKALMEMGKKAGEEVSNYVAEVKKEISEIEKMSDENELLKKVFDECEGNISMISRKLGISRNTLYKKLRMANIKG